MVFYATVQERNVVSLFVPSEIAHESVHYDYLHVLLKAMPTLQYAVALSLTFLS
jgi:hypothetical protein